jgi:hypothetical protein
MPFFFFYRFFPTPYISTVITRVPPRRPWEIKLIFFLQLIYESDLNGVSMTPSDPNGFSEPPAHSLLVLYSNFIGVKWEKEALVPRVHEGNTGSTSGTVAR